MKEGEVEGRQRDKFVAFFGLANTGLGDGPGVWSRSSSSAIYGSCTLNASMILVGNSLKTPTESEPRTEYEAGSGSSLMRKRNLIDQQRSSMARELHSTLKRLP